MVPLLRRFTSRQGRSGFLRRFAVGSLLALSLVHVSVSAPAQEHAQTERFATSFWLVGAAAAVVALLAGLAIGSVVGRRIACKARADTSSGTDGQSALRASADALQSGVVARVAESAHQSEERHARPIEASAAGYWDWKLSTGDLFLSPRARDLHALPPEARFADHAQFAACIPFHTDDRQRVREVVSRTLDAGADHYELDFRVVTSAGDTRWLRALGKIYRDVSGAPEQIAETLIDVTEQKIAQEQLLRSEARFRSLTELLSDWYWRQDEELRFTYLSSQANDLTGYSGDSSHGKRRWELLNLTPLSGSWTEHQAALAARQSFRDLECCRIGPDGVARYLSMSGAPIYDEQGRFEGYHGIGRNITERMRIERELRARQDLLELAQKAARAVAFEWRVDGQEEGIRVSSPELEAMLGLAPGSYDGTYESWKRLVHPDDAAAIDVAMLHAAETGEVTIEHRLANPAGSERWLQVKGRLSSEGDGRNARLVGFMFDVTERHQAEVELRRLEKQLRQAQRLEAMGALAGGIAHDFNNILGAVLGYAERAWRDAAKGSRQRSDLDRVMTAGERGRALVDQILAFSRSSSSKRVAVHMQRVVAEALDHLAARVPANVTVTTRLSSGDSAVLGDTTQVHQVLTNLATNALQAMPSGGTLDVSLASIPISAPRVVTTGALEAGDYVVLEVSDSGVGIPPEVIDRIFDPFFTTKEVGVGTGLGLSLVHGIVAELGGAISVASTPGAGSVFTVYLPRAGDVAGEVESETTDLQRGDSQRVLVVDDEEPLMRIATETLEELGYVAVGFTSSTAALEAFRRDSRGFDVVLTDERMPNMTGSALIRAVRLIRPGIPVVLMSGFIAGSVSSAAREKGADDVIQKPLLRRDLAGALARVLNPTRGDGG